MLAETVVQQRSCIGREGEQPALTPAGRRLLGGLDQLCRLALLAPQCCEQHCVLRERRVTSRLRNQAIFVNHHRCCVQLAGEQMGPGQIVERELQVHQGARAAGELGLAGG